MTVQKKQEYSVLMSVYHKENPVFFKKSIESMLQQTLPLSDFVLVCDGPLSGELEEVIEWASGELKEKLQCIRLAENRGLGNALKIGVTYCKCPVIARMDSDDISRADRCERQMKEMDRTGCAIISGTLQEFVNEPGDTDTLRVLPETAEEIRAFSKKRNPFNHPCVMYQKGAVLSAGNYQDFPGFEDYYLWMRMLKKGYRGYNIREVILDMRTGNGMYQRRGGKQYLLWLLRFQKTLLDEKMISRMQFYKNCMVRISVSLAPNGLREAFYRIFLRK